MVERTPHPGPLPIGSADSADAEREKRSQHLGKLATEFCSVASNYKRSSNGCPLSQRERVRVRESHPNEKAATDLSKPFQRASIVNLKS